MKRSILSYYILILLLGADGIQAYARSVHRPQDTALPKISVRSSDNKLTYDLQSSHLEFYPFFGVFDKKFFNEHFLPSGHITYRNDPQQAVKSSALQKCIEKLVEEIQAKKRTYSHFKVLTAKNFNRKKICGMMILKFNDYPFILKLGIETPETFINPYCKGLDNIWFFPLGGGINRHMAGLTRIKNLETIKAKLALHNQWSTLVDVPRKWYWAPKKGPWLEIEGSNIGGLKKVNTKIPGIYAIIADEIEAEQTFNLFNKEQTKMALDICNYLDLWIDPHINNFMIEKGTKKVVIVDTEHFPSVVGIKEKVAFDSYTSWYLYLMGKCTKDWFFRTKPERQEAQNNRRFWS